MKEESKKPNVGHKDSAKMIAKKDFHLVCGAWDKKTGKNEVDVKIKKGDSVDVPEKFIKGLKAEGVL